MFGVGHRHQDSSVNSVCSKHDPFMDVPAWWQWASADTTPGACANHVIGPSRGFVIIIIVMMGFGPFCVVLFAQTSYK